MTKTTLKFDIQGARRGERTAVSDLQTQLLELAGDWQRPEWVEGDWSKINDLTFIELRQAKQQETGMILNCACLSCPDFVTHVSCHYRLISNGEAHADGFP